MLLTNQKSAISKLSTYKVGALFMEAGTGKTRVALELVNSVADVDLVIWVGPYGTINPKENLPSIKDEINKWRGFTAPVIYVAIESLQSSDRIYLELRNMIETADKPFLVVDESLKIKNSTAKRTKRLLDFSNMVEYKLILNGTPLSRNLLDLWSQMEFLSPKILNMGLSEFKNTFCEYTKVTKRLGYRSFTKEFITSYENIDYLYSLIHYYIYECDLNLQITQMYNVICYSLSDEEKEQYNYFKTKYLDNEMLFFKNNNIFLEMTQKMQHVYCCSDEKVQKVKELFGTIDESKTIIYTKYIDSHNLCEKMFPKATILSYQKESFGLNLQQFNHTIYFDKIWDYALRVQAGRRTFRTGQQFDCKYYDLTGNVGLETLIDKNIDKKISMVEYFKGKTKEELKELL